MTARSSSLIAVGDLSRRSARVCGGMKSRQMPSGSTRLVGPVLPLPVEHVAAEVLRDHAERAEVAVGAQHVLQVGARRVGPVLVVERMAVGGLAADASTTSPSAVEKSKPTTCCSYAVRETLTAGVDRVERDVASVRPGSGA